MRSYKVRISLAARADMVELRKFLKAMMTDKPDKVYTTAPLKKS